MKVYNQAPLPFMGQKRKFLKEFKAQLSNYPANAVYVDLFGGSGLLSRTVKDTHPGAVVIYNDFDNYSQRVKAIPETNLLISKIRDITNGLPDSIKMPTEIKTKILELLKNHQGFVDYITISSSVLFSMTYAISFETLAKETFYNKVRQSPYDGVGYFEGLEIVSMDYKDLFSKYEKAPNVVFLIDPPYLSTEAGTYTGYWRLNDYLDVLDTLRVPCFFYFTSNKSQILELCEWMGARTNFKNPFSSANTSTTAVTMNHTSSYTDIMMFKYEVKK